MAPNVKNLLNTDKVHDKRKKTFFKKKHGKKKIQNQSAMVHKKNDQKTLYSVKNKKQKENNDDMEGVDTSTKSFKNSIKSKKNNKINIKHLKGMFTAREKRSFNFNNSNEAITLRERMMIKLRSSRFRYLNEMLYNNSSSQSNKYFKEDPDAFIAYHNGYKQQVEHWPLNPLDIVIESIKKMPNEYVIADFGCGEARLAASVSQKVHSFDLISINERVKACDIAHTPLLTQSVHVVVFCLSLMGNNLNDYIIEANRVLKKEGILKIVEVESRFTHLNDFIKLFNDYGFLNTWKDSSHNLFHFLDFKKISDINKNRNKLPLITLKPCLYKKR